MKKIVMILILIIINFVMLTMVVPLNTAYALDFPYIVIDGEVWLLDKTTGNRIFLLPESYYAKIDNIDDSYYYVTFNGVNGKVDKTKVSSVGYHTTATGTILDLQIGEKYRIFTGIKLKSTMDSSGTDIEVPTNESLIFLGKYPSTDMWYYVKYNEVCGYIRAEFTTQPSLVIPTFVPEDKPITDGGETPAPDDGKIKPTPDLIKILVISGLCVGLAIIIILVFRPHKNKNNRYYYEE